jgi:hypothetical protein
MDLLPLPRLHLKAVSDVTDVAGVRQKKKRNYPKMIQRIIIAKYAPGRAGST